MQTAKEYLREIATLQAWIECGLANIRMLRRDMDEISESISDITAITYDGVSVQTSPINGQENRIINAIDRETRIQKRINRQLDKVENYRDAVTLRIDQIGALPDMYSRILKERYVDGKNFEEIAAGIPMSYSWVTHLHGEALLMFEKKFLTGKTRQEKARKNKNFQKSV